MMTSNPSQVRIAALFGALAVILGAFGAHALKATLSAQAIENWQTASHYHLIHAVVLLVIGAAGLGRWGWNAIATGTVLFSGSLYMWSLTGIHWLVFVTPVGGLLLIIGWVLVAFRK